MTVLENDEPWLLEWKARYPRLFRPDSFELGAWVLPGWYAIVDEFLKGLDELLDAEQVQRFRMIQLKQKFAGLRFYWELDGRPDSTIDLGHQGVVVQAKLVSEGQSDAAERIDALVRIAEAKAACTCEICGAPGERREGAWWMTLCDRHHAERERPGFKGFGR